VYRISFIAVAALFAFSYAMAGTTAIGTASARGSMRVDGSVVNGNATLFDGTVVETSEATTAVRLDKGVEIKLATDSRGTLYRDRLVLEKGAGELAAGRFLLQASGLSVTPDAPNSRGVVSFQDPHTVQVSALQGNFHVANSQGLLLASVQPGHMMLFNMQQAGATAPTTVTGLLTRETDKCAANGGKKFYITVNETGVKYEVTGEDLDSKVGKTVTLTGTPDPNAQPTSCAAGVLVASSVAVVAGAAGGAAVGAAAGAGWAAGHVALITGVAIAAAAGTGVGIYEATKSPTPASQ
jgi:hypothetical protein